MYFLISCIIIGAPMVVMGFVIYAIDILTHGDEMRRLEKINELPVDGAEESLEGGIACLGILVLSIITIIVLR